MTTAPVIVFDVNETLSDLSPMAARFVDVGAPASLAGLWFSRVLRDGFALTVVDASEPFARICEEVGRSVLAEAVLNRSVDEAVAHLMDGFRSLQLHADVVPAVRALAGSGHRLVTLSNGGVSVAERLLGDADVRAEFEHVLSVDDAGAWKPDRRAYEYAARTCGVPVEEMVMVAVHPWDLDGAARAGLRTVWLDRSEGHYPATFTAPTYTVGSLEELPDVLAGSALPGTPPAR